MYRRVGTTCEMSCDVTAVKKTGVDAASYLSTVLYLMCATRGITDRFTTAMAGNTRRVKERFSVVSHASPRRAVTVISVVIAAVLLTGAVCVGGVVDTNFNEIGHAVNQGLIVNMKGDVVGFVNSE